MDVCGVFFFASAVPASSPRWQHCSAQICPGSCQLDLPTGEASKIEPCRDSRSIVRKMKPYFYILTCVFLFIYFFNVFIIYNPGYFVLNI